MDFKISLGPGRVIYGIALLVIWSWSAQSKKNPQKDILSKKPLNIQSRIRSIKKKLKGFKGKANKFILNSKYRSSLIKRIGIKNAEKFEKKVFKMEQRILREKELFSKILSSLGEIKSEKRLNDIVEYILFIFNEENHIMIDPRDASSEMAAKDDSPATVDEDFAEPVVVDSKKGLKLEYSISRFWDGQDSESENASEVSSNWPDFSQTVSALPRRPIVGGAVTQILYEGTWTSKQTAQNNYLFSFEGRFLGMLSIEENNVARFIFQLYTNRYIDTPTIVSNISFKLSDSELNQFSHEAKAAISKENNLFRSDGQENCNIQIDFCMQKKDSKQPMTINSDDVANVQIFGSILSPDCFIDLMFEGEVSIPEYAKALLFTLFQILFSGLGILPLYRIASANNSARMLILSEWSFLFNIMVDFVLVVINLRFSIKILVEYFEFLTVITLFLMFSILFKVKFYINAYDFRSLNCGLSQQEHSRRKLFFILKFTAFSFFFVSCGTFFIEYEFLFYLLFCSPLFQVWHNVTSVSQSNCFLWSVHPLLSFSQVLYPIVMKGLRFSFFKLTPVPYFSYVLVLQLLFCMSIFLLQKIFGATFFLPRFLIPNYYNYSRKFADHPADANLSCPICFNRLIQNGFAPCNDEAHKKNELFLLKEYLMTPCGHKFHHSCLASWMEQKLICPFCRTKIPPIL